MLTKWLSIPWGISPLICQTSFGVQVQPLETMSIWRSLNQLLWRASSLVEQFPKPDSIMYQISLYYFHKTSMVNYSCTTGYTGFIHNSAWWSLLQLFSFSQCSDSLPCHQMSLYILCRWVNHCSETAVSDQWIWTRWNLLLENSSCWVYNLKWWVFSAKGIVVTCYPTLRGRKRG